MTTFKNNSKYAELLFGYLDVAVRADTPLTVQQVLRAFHWRFKGGSLAARSAETRLKPETSGDVFPEGNSWEMADAWPQGVECQALHRILRNRAAEGKMRNRAILARIGTYQLLTSSFGHNRSGVQIHTGMQGIYNQFARLWEWSKRAGADPEWDHLQEFTSEFLLGASAVSRMHLPAVAALNKEYRDNLAKTPLPGLLQSVRHIKELIRLMNGPTARKLARQAGLEERRRWGDDLWSESAADQEISDVGTAVRCVTAKLGGHQVLVSQGVVLCGSGMHRVAMGPSDVERLHQLTMSAASALVGVATQASIGTIKQKQKSRLAVETAVANIERIVRSSSRVPLGDEVLVCKGYRRAYTAFLGMLAGPLCRDETENLISEARETCATGVLDVDGFLSDLGQLDAASAMNAAKMFKICPAPDVSPGLAMLDRIDQIGNCNVVDQETMPKFEAELRAQILRAHIRHSKTRLSLRDRDDPPAWLHEYLRGDYDSVPSDEIDKYLVWEGTATMPDISPYDPAHWKDSGLGADTRKEAMSDRRDPKKMNMITRLIFDDECPMPGTTSLSSDRAIKFFMKAEGHKDPARGIFSANLRDRQAQSWMERAVDQVAREHPSFMIGQPVNEREAKVIQLTTRPSQPGHVAMFYSFDISGWSARMPAEPQHISHRLWAELHGGHLFDKARGINEGAFVYLNMDGYRGWYINTAANLEGFNGKEMTMVLVALLSLSVKRWRERVCCEGLMSEVEARSTSALLFAYIDDGLCRIDLPGDRAQALFGIYKETVIDTFKKCGFTIEVSKCFPSDRFAIFLNEVYLAGRHVVHGVRAAMGISSEPTERHTTLVERLTSVSTGVRGAVMAGLDPVAATQLLAYHSFLHIWEWTDERDPRVLAAWCLCPRSWGGLGLPNAMQLFVSGSGSAFEEGIATLQAYARANRSVRSVYLGLARSDLKERDAVGVLNAPLSGRVTEGYMVDSRVSVWVRKALQRMASDGTISPYARRLLRYADTSSYSRYAERIVPLGETESLQEQMLVNIAEAHPHSVFSSFANRLEKSMTVLTIVGRQSFVELLQQNRAEARQSSKVFRDRFS